MDAFGTLEAALTAALGVMASVTFALWKRGNEQTKEMQEKMAVENAWVREKLHECENDRDKLWADRDKLWEVVAGLRKQLRSHEEKPESE